MKKQKFSQVQMGIIFSLVMTLACCSIFAKAASTQILAQQQLPKSVLFEKGCSDSSPSLQFLANVPTAQQGNTDYEEASEEKLDNCNGVDSCGDGICRRYGMGASQKAYPNGIDQCKRTGVPDCHRNIGVCRVDTWYNPRCQGSPDDTIYVDRWGCKKRRS